MIDFLEPTEPFGRQTQRLCAEAQEGGGDVFEIAAVCRRIEPGDADGWAREWDALAETVETRARAELAAGHTASAMRHFFHANNYYRQSDLFIPRGDPRKREHFIKARSCFREAAKLHPTPIEVIEVDLGDGLYDGYLCHPANPVPGKWPAVMLIGGADSYSEEIFFSGRQFLDRDIALYLVDTPGRGAAIYLNDIKARPDYEVPISAAIDYLAGRPEIDADRIGIVGISMAGYYAPRAAAFDRRIKAMVAWCGTYDLLNDVSRFGVGGVKRHQWITGGKDEEDTVEKLKAFTLEGLGSDITCPALISHGKEDRLMSAEGAVKLYDAIASEDKELRIWDTPPGNDHCQFDAWTVAVPYMFDWLADRL